MKFEDEILNYKLLNNTFSLSGANPKISGNIKLVVDDGSIYLSSIQANEGMSFSSLQNYVVDINKPLRSNIKSFCDISPNKTAFYQLPPQDFNVGRRYKEQVSDLYRYGSKSDTDKRIDSTHRYFAPLFISKEQGLPSGFAIFKLHRNATDEVETLSNDNCELVKYYSLGNKTAIGELLQNHYSEFSQREVGISVNFEDSISVIGIDINKGVIAEKDAYTKSEFLLENTITESELLITNAYQKANMIDPRFLNLEFCYDLDLTKQENNDTFVEVVGFYVWENEIASSSLNPSQNLNLAYTTDYLQTDSEIILTEPLYDVVGNINGASVGQIKNPTAVIKFNSIPNTTQKFSFTYNSLTEIELTIDSSHRGTDLSSTIDLIVTALTEKVKTDSQNFILEFNRFGSDELHVISKINSSVFEGIEIPIVPVSCKVLEPFIGNFSGSNPNLFSSDTTSITLSNKNIDSTIDAIRFSDDTVAIPSLGFKYLSVYSYKTNQDLTDKDLLNIKLLRGRDVKYYSLDNCEHRKFDFNRNISYHSEPYDFDVVKFRDYLLGRVNDLTLRINDPSSVLSESAYRTLLQERIDAYFSVIDVKSKSILIDKIDKADFTITSTDNEYKPLQEFNDINYLKGSMNPYISKFAIRDGKDISNSPQKYNTSMIFRYDSLTPNIKNVFRDISKFSHSWYLIASGKPPYYTDFSGYTASSTTVTDLLNTSSDAYSDKITEFGHISTDPLSKVTSTFFRGLRVVTEDRFDGYKFSCVLISDTAPSNTDVAIKVYENETFKTLTLVVNQFISEPILTNLEQPPFDYYLDRSVLYYSSGGNATVEQNASIGEEPISLFLYDNGTQKTYSGLSVGTSWIYNDNGTSVANIKLNNSVNSFDFTSMFGIGENFEITSGDIVTTDPSLYGMKINFNNIVQVSADNFWCSEIIVTMTIGGIIDTFSIIPEYVADPNILLSNNDHALAQSVAKYNSVFQRTIKNTLGGKRYDLISVGSIANTLRASNIGLEDASGNEKTCDLRIVTNLEIPINQSYKYNYATYGLDREDTIHRFYVLRPSFYYDPITSVMIERQNLNIDISHSDIQYVRKCSTGLKIFPYNNNTNNLNRIPLKSKDYGVLDFDKWFSYNRTHTESDDIKWFYAPNEIKGYVSKNISVSQELFVEYTYTNGRIDVEQLLNSYAKKVLNSLDFINFNIDEVDYKNALRVTNENLDNITEDRIKTLIYRSLIVDVLIEVLRIEYVEIGGVKYDTSRINEINFRILDVQENSGDCIVKLIHQ